MIYALVLLGLAPVWLAYQEYGWKAALLAAVVLYGVLWWSLTP